MLDHSVTPPADGAHVPRPRRVARSLADTPGRNYQDAHGRAMTVLAALIASGDPGRRYPSGRHAAFTARYRDRSFWYAVADLVRDGYLQRHTNGGVLLGRAKRRTNAYRVTPAGDAAHRRWHAARIRAALPVPRPLTYAERRQRQTAAAAARAQRARARLGITRRRARTFAHNPPPPMNIQILTTETCAREPVESGGPLRGPAPPEPPSQRCPVNGTRWPDLPYHCPSADGTRCVDCRAELLPVTTQPGHLEHG